MTITIDLQPEIERSLQARAEAKGVSLAVFAQEVLAREAATTSSPSSTADVQNLYDLFAPVRGLLTDEEVDMYFSRAPSSTRVIDFD